jgi:hypothetical protein
MCGRYITAQAAAFEKARPARQDPLAIRAQLHRRADAVGPGLAAVGRRGRGSDDALAVYQVSARVNGPNNNGDKLIMPVEPDRD